ncbi:DapH/DapD/GlmU-related protein [Streptomyces canus]|uniref:DapH/DapD/GlmU-related protein n=1 Tax=Streptomyces canus TaxID=58343 RepID=UPI002E26C7A8
MDHPSQPSVRHFDHCPWLFADAATEEQRAAQREVQRTVGGDTGIGERCYVAESAAVFPDRLRLGDDSYIAAHAYVTGELDTGSHCTLNPFTTVRGNVVLGDGVRIGAHTSLLGFNHSMAPDRPVYRQPLTSRGIRVGDDVWIGSHVIVVDGVTIGDHCVIGAGAVVTRNLPAWSVAAGNPARVLRDRREVRGVRAAAAATPALPGMRPDDGRTPTTRPARDPEPGAAPADNPQPAAHDRRPVWVAGAANAEAAAAAPGRQPDDSCTPTTHPAPDPEPGAAAGAPERAPHDRREVQVAGTADSEAAAAAPGKRQDDGRTPTDCPARDHEPGAAPADNPQPAAHDRRAGWVAGAANAEAAAAAPGRQPDDSCTPTTHPAPDPEPGAAAGDQERAPHDRREVQVAGTADSEAAAAAPGKRQDDGRTPTDCPARDPEPGAAPADNPQLAAHDRRAVWVAGAANAEAAAAAPGRQPDDSCTPTPRPAPDPGEPHDRRAVRVAGAADAEVAAAVGAEVADLSGIRPGGDRTPTARPAPDPRTATLAAFADTARDQAAGLLDRCWDGERYVDRPGAVPTVRAHCDAVEIADLLLGAVPEHLSTEEHIGRLSGLQDPKSGLVPEFGEPLPVADADGFIGEGAALYHVLCVGYALDLLGPGIPHPVRGVRDMTARQLIVRLEALPWLTGAWGAGAWVDSLATAAHWNLRHDDGGDSGHGTPEALFGWLLTRADPWTGLWGSPSAEEGRLQVVNGYYRLTRGSFAQFGLPVPYPERVVDAVLDHARDARHFGPGRENACNVLDVAHPLWLCTQQLGRGADGYRSGEIHDWAERQLATVLPRWQDGRGFGFGPGAAGPGPEPGLQGTEMWLAIVWYLADLLGRTAELGYRPRGIHRPEPARQGITGLSRAGGASGS